MYAGLSAALASFSLGLLTSKWLQAPGPFICDCTPDSSREGVLDLLRSQLDRCGPEHLVREPAVRAPVTPPVEVEASSWYPLSLIALLSVLVIALLGVIISFCVGETLFEGARSGAGAKPALEDAPRWSPPAGSRARRLS